jgi:hypothetical protein
VAFDKGVGVLCVVVGDIPALSKPWYVVDSVCSALWWNKCYLSFSFVSALWRCVHWHGRGLAASRWAWLVC